MACILRPYGRNKRNLLLQARIFSRLCEPRLLCTCLTWSPRSMKSVSFYHSSSTAQPPGSLATEVSYLDGRHSINAYRYPLYYLTQQESMGVLEPKSERLQLGQGRFPRWCHAGPMRQPIRIAAASFSCCYPARK